MLTAEVVGGYLYLEVVVARAGGSRVERHVSLWVTEAEWSQIRATAACAGSSIGGFLRDLALDPAAARHDIQALSAHHLEAVPPRLEAVRLEVVRSDLETVGGGKLVRQGGRSGPTTPRPSPPVARAVTVSDVEDEQPYRAWIAGCRERGIFGALVTEHEWGADAVAIIADYIAGCDLPEIRIGLGLADPMAPDEQRDLLAELPAALAARGVSGTLRACVVAEYDRTVTIIDARIDRREAVRVRSGRRRR